MGAQSIYETRMSWRANVPLPPGVRSELRRRAEGSACHVGTLIRRLIQRELERGGRLTARDLHIDTIESRIQIRLPDEAAVRVEQMVARLGADRGAILRGLIRRGLAHSRVSRRGRRHMPASAA